MAVKIINGYRVSVGANGKLAIPKFTADAKGSKTSKEIEALLKIAQDKGLGDVVKDKPKKLSALQRLGTGLNTFNPVNAIYGSQFLNRDPVAQYGKDIVRRIGSAITGKIDSEPDYSGAELVGKAGVQNKIAKFGLGFAADVLLDPTTYVGGFLAKGALKVAKVATSPVAKVARKVAPGAVAGLVEAKTGAVGALKKAFQRGGDASEGLLDDVTDVQGKLDESLQNVYRDAEMRTGALSKEQNIVAGREVQAVRQKVFQETQQREQKIVQEFEQKFGKFPEGETRTIVGNLEKQVQQRVARNQQIIKTLKAKAPKAPRIAQLTRENVQLQNELVDKSRLLWAKDDAYLRSHELFDRVPNLTKHGFTPQEQAIFEAELKRNKTNAVKFLVQTGKLQPDTVPEVYMRALANKQFLEVNGLKDGLQSVKHFGPGSEDWLKQYRATLKPENLELNFSRVNASTEAELLKSHTLETALKDMVKKYGVKSEAEARKLGYVPITRKGYAGTIGEVIGYMSKPDAELLGAFMGKAEFATLDLIAKRLGFDAVTSLFKRSVTGLFAPFHVRNWVSGILQNYQILGPAALNPKNMALGSRISKAIALGKDFGDETIELAGQTYKLQDLIQSIKYRFFGGSFIADIGDATKTLADSGKVISEQSIKSTVKTLGLGQDAIGFRAARKVGEFIETQQKATATITALSQGKGLPQALELARQAGFDYRNLTGFESKILRRIIPFYAFARFNAGLQIRTLLQHPDRTSNIIKMFRNAGDAFGGSTTQEDRESLPDYLANGFGFKIGVDKNGNPIYTNSFGTPVEAFMQWIDKNPVLKVMSNMNPILKTPLELGTGKDSFRQRDLSTVYSANEYSTAPQIIKDLLDLKPVQRDKYENGKPTGEKYTVYVANPQKLLIARGLFTSRGATYLDQVFDGEVSGLAKAMNLITGIKAFPVDLERTAEFELRDRQTEIEDLLLRYGAAKQFRKVYVPKEKTNDLPGLANLLNK